MMPSEIITWECGIVAGATAGDGIGDWAGPPVAQAPVLLAAVVGEAGATATASDGGGSCLCSRELFLCQHMWQMHLRLLQKLLLLLPHASG